MNIDDIDTPAILIDLDVAEANMARAQTYADTHGLALRPHIKTHRLPYFARRQVELGAKGINCQKLGEAEVMADAGLTDILITFNIIGKAKLDRLAALHARVSVAVVADNVPVIEGYAARFTDAGHPLDVLVECDTGAERNGVQSAQQALDLARLIDAAPGLRFAGLLTYPPSDPKATGAWLTKARQVIEDAGIAVPKVSSGGSPTLYAAHETDGINEYRVGTYIFSDRMQVAAGLGTIQDCALSVLLTVASRPTENRATLDGGSKALAADICAAPGHGHILEHPDAIVTKLSEEHAVVDLAACAEKPGIGARVRVIPNHVCVVVNLFDKVHLMRGNKVEQVLDVSARGKSN
ncbi:D-TA family PLP-dependent enzyme [Szabonella alba]|uniref:D-TA family PLP-dependent enzyme n=1 Tax=Szabonella alba TaxID=2804194 RepID=A0A8K0V7G5_9RHOB|nr:D-TA family PLP-dependent enzyme [Szabonella alba]MBL4916541.1 D-TA family PLP-dependent enzyme [Szabonella alba]